MSFKPFLTKLAKHPSTQDLSNPYRKKENKWNRKRWHNLNCYFEQMTLLEPKLLLVGEAPGYRGCRLTGIPFVSPSLLEEGLPNGDLFGIDAGYAPISEWDHVRRESSSTIMWGTLTQLPVLPLLWNACPYHPHKPESMHSNRAPKRAELDLGRPFIIQLLKLFPIEMVVAVGNKADHALNLWGIEHEKVRHPSHGGKRPFQSQLLQLSEKMNPRR